MDYLSLLSSSLQATSREVTWILATLGLIGGSCFVALRYWTIRSVDAPEYWVDHSGKDIGGYPSVSAIINETYTKFKNDVYVLKQHYGNVVVIPPAFIEGLKAAPENVLSFQGLARERFFGDYTLLTSVDPPEHSTIIQSIKNDLTKNIGPMIDDVTDEIQYSFSHELPACEDWTAVYPAYSFLRVIALASGRVFIGKNLNRNEEFLNCTTSFAIDSIMAAEALRKYPQPLRPIVTWFLPELKRVRGNLRTMKNLIAPSLQAHLQGSKAKTEHIGNLLAWNVKNSPKSRVGDVWYQAHNQLLVSAAAIHTTNMQLSHILFDLAAHPECIEPLREELTDYVSIKASPRANLSSLWKLDSFLKESQRMNPLGLINFERRVMSDLVLPNGIKVPRGNYIGAPMGAVAKDPILWDRPEEFDAFRFEKLRKLPGNENKYQFASTSQDAFHFGHGTHACPGRFFAAAEIKLILIHLILNYDVKFPDGESRPANIEMNAGLIPDGTKAVLLKRRK